MIQKFSEIKEDQLSLVGGKGLSLAKMVQGGLPVPSGFVATTEAYDNFAEAIPDKEFANQLNRAFKELDADRVAVRSSAIAEDAASASWAGQLDTYLNIDQFGLLDAVRKCWSSVSSERVKQYASQQKVAKDDLKVAVVVQTMVDSDASGVMFTANPITGNRDQIMIEASYGLGEMIVQGEVTPDNYIVENRKVVARRINEKNKMMVWRDNQNSVEDVPSDKKQEQALRDAKIIELASLGKNIEDFYGSPQDIEWCLHGSRLFIVQARPITTLKEDGSGSSVQVSDDRIISTGIGASQGIVTGTVKVVTSLNQLKNMQEGDILVTHKTTPDYVEAFTKVAKIVTESGGVTSHVAIVSRELGIPAVVGTVDITLRVKGGDQITVDGYAGYIYSGEVKPEGSTQREFSFPQPTGDDIEDMVNAIATGINDANELWPLAPGQLMPYIDADQSMDMYLKLKQLEDSGMSESEVAKLFERPIFIKMFLLNTGIVGLKSANIFEKRASKYDQIEFVTKMLKLAKILNKNDENHIVSRNYLWNEEEASKFIEDAKWNEADNGLKKAINVLSVNLLALNWAMYWDYFPEAGHELHGVYPADRFGEGSRMIVKDYFNLAVGDVWDYAKNHPYNTVRLAQIYDTDRMYLNFGNRLVGENFSNHNTHFVLIVDGNPVSDQARIEHMSVELKKLADAQVKHVNQLKPMEKVRKGAQISYFTRKKFYQHFNNEWYPEDMVEGTIKAIGTKFIDENGEAKPMSLEDKKTMWDPRNELMP